MSLYLGRRSGPNECDESQCPSMSQTPGTTKTIETYSMVWTLTVFSILWPSESRVPRAGQTEETEGGRKGWYGKELSGGEPVRLSGPVVPEVSDYVPLGRCVGDFIRS